MGGGAAGSRVAHRLGLGVHPCVMGVINATPDSLWEASRLAEPEAAAQAAREMVAAGAALVDLGAVSTRPGAPPVDASTELARLLPVLRAVRAAVPVPLSVDTTRAEVVRQAVAGGAEVINAVGGLDDPEFLAALAAVRVPVIAVATARVPPTGSVLETVAQELEAGVARLAAAGVDPDLVWADPGFGFGKRVAQNLQVVRGIPWLRARLRRPLCLGPSRKGSIGHLLGGRAVAGRLSGTLALVALAAAYGADLLRVHDVAAACDVARIGQACGAPVPSPRLAQICIRGLRLAGTHGVLPPEHIQPQPFIVDIELEVDITAAVRSDRLTDTVDYARAARVAAGVVEGPHHDLIESLAGEIARGLAAAFPGVRGGTVTVHKPEAPVGLPFGDVVVRLPFDARGDPATQ